MNTHVGGCLSVSLVFRIKDSDAAVQGQEEDFPKFQDKVFNWCSI